MRRLPTAPTRANARRVAKVWDRLSTGSRALARGDSSVAVREVTGAVDDMSLAGDRRMLLGTAFPVLIEAFSRSGRDDVALLLERAGAELDAADLDSASATLRELLAVLDARSRAAQDTPAR